MGLFDKPVVDCGICGREIGKKEKRTATDDEKYVCNSCFEKATLTQSILTRGTLEDIEKLIEANEFRENQIEKLHEFKPTLNVHALHVNEDSRQWYIGEDPSMYLYVFADEPVPQIYKLDDIIDIQVLLNGSYSSETLTNESNTSSKLKRALIGGALGGSTGAIIGAMTAPTSSASVITTTHEYDLVIFFESSVFVSKCGNELIPREMESALRKLLKVKSPSQCELIDSTPSSADEIRKYKELLDDGIITQEDFDAKKKQLLGL